MSSMCSIGEWQREHPERPLIPEDVAWDPASAMANGYGESKCIAEQLLAHAHALTGLRVAIVRAAQVGGPSPASTGSKRWSVPGWLYVIIKTSERLNYWPTFVNALDWIPVDTLAEGITNITITQPKDEAVQVYNMVFVEPVSLFRTNITIRADYLARHPHPAPWSLLTNRLQHNFGLSAQEVSLPKWLDMVDPRKFKLYAFLRAAGQGREFTLAYEQHNALELLPKIGAIDEKQLDAWMKGWDLQIGQNRARL